MKIDLYEFARQGGTSSATIPLARLPRVDTPVRSGGLSWKARASPLARHGHPQLDLDIDGEIELVCQRCLQPMTHAVAIRSHFVIAHDEKAGAVLDQSDDYDVIVGTADFDLETLIEDEVILALPIAPRHPVCPDDSLNAAYKAEKRSPFALLADLKSAIAPAQSKKTDRDDDGAGR